MYTSVERIYGRKKVRLSKEGGNFKLEWLPVESIRPIALDERGERRMLIERGTLDVGALQSPSPVAGACSCSRSTREKRDNGAGPPSSKQSGMLVSPEKEIMVSDVWYDELQGEENASDWMEIALGMG
ncbi:hypothetical protein L1887_14832 [Cichorium endivia]|nr:hypothetical protein L1887_14832 [Cichorium endivia]